MRRLNLRPLISVLPLLLCNLPGCKTFKSHGDNLVIGDYSAVQHYLHSTSGVEGDINTECFFAETPIWLDKTWDCTGWKYKDPQRRSILQELERVLFEEGFNQIFLIEKINQESESPAVCVMVKGNTISVFLVKFERVDESLQAKILRMPSANYPKNFLQIANNLEEEIFLFSKNSPPFLTASGGHMPTYCFSVRERDSDQSTSFCISGLIWSDLYESLYQKHLNDPRFAKDNDYFERTRSLAIVLKAFYSAIDLK